MAKTPEIDVRDNYGKNYIINGDMRISQRGTSFPTIANGTYSLDRFTYTKVGAMVHTVSQDADVPTFIQAGYLFQNSLLATLTTPDTSIAAGDLLKFEQHIEGYNWAQIANKPFTLSFWVKATLPSGGPQTYCMAFGNSDSTRVYVSEYTINASDTWEYKTITVPPPSDGTWNYTNGSGLRIHWSIAVGSTFHGAAGVWNTSATFSTANQVNGTNTGYTSFRLTGIMLNQGYEALPFRLFGESVQGEIAACQRYYEKTYDLTTAPGTVTFTGAHSFNHPGGVGVEGNYYFRVSKRVNANPVYYSPQTGASGVFRDSTNGVDRATATLRTGQNNIAFSTSGVPVGAPDIAGHIVADTEL